MSAFDKKRLLSNIAYRAKELNVKMGDLELAAGVSTGYISRLKGEDIKTSPNIEFVATIAEKLDVTIDALVRVDYEALSPSEHYLIDFIDAAIARTNASAMHWVEESIQKIENAGTDELGRPVHPLFCKTVNKKLSKMKSRQIYNPDPEYYSAYHPDEFVDLCGPVYHAKIDDKSLLWITHINVYKTYEDNDDEYEETFDEVELYMQIGEKVSPLCHTSAKGSNPFNDFLPCLYTAAERSSKQPRIDPDVKNVIDGFMDNDLPF